MPGAVHRVRRSRSLLYDQGLPIGGARQRLKEMPRTVVAAAHRALPVKQPQTKKQQLASLRSELESLLKLFDR